MQGRLPTSLLLVGNKVDLEEFSRREIPCDVGENFAQVSEILLTKLANVVAIRYIMLIS